MLLTFINGQDIDCRTLMERVIADFLPLFSLMDIDAKGDCQSDGQYQRAQQGRVPKETRPVGYATGVS